jgi:hypothetical protein
MKTWMCALMLALSTGASAQNPIISGQYSADPTARVFNGKMYLYPSHDIPSPIEKLKEWFCMAGAAIEEGGRLGVEHIRRNKACRPGAKCRSGVAVRA